MNVNEIQDLIKFVAKAGVNEVEIEKEVVGQVRSLKYKVRVKSFPMVQ